MYRNRLRKAEDYIQTQPEDYVAEHRKSNSTVTKLQKEEKDHGKSFIQQSGGA